ncbi:pilus assembly protein CpaE [Sphingomonas lutea]|uniref:Pilus assembly protein CpaE n=1 Tax=Sphingomonas lutea TaxID=1045317 RepID=A0A7G9SJ89_9SPHN|nr:pilus assembly protein CpaE [Sphingomonas lutea]QNN67914.1 pilus assembly protein CpaE [Sphingomonas lutea]
MSVINPNETARTWKATTREASVQLFLSGVEGDAAALVGARVADFPLGLNIVPTGDAISADDLAGAAAAVVQVDADNPASIKRFEQLARQTTTPLIAAAYDPPLAIVRALVRVGAHDVVPLPLSIDELETSVAPIRDELNSKQVKAAVRTSKIVSVVKGLGGVGATSLVTQFASRFAANERQHGRDACLIDLDVQFGDVAFQLGLQPRLSLVELLEAGGRLDGELLRATATEHASGLHVIAAPADMMPLESLSSDHVMEIVELAGREYGTVFIDLPTNWTNWSLSLLAQSDLVLLVTELTVAGLNRAKRQLNLIQSQDLGSLDVRIVINRFEKSLLRTIRPNDVREALGRDIGYTVSNDFRLMSAAIDRGVPIDDIKRKTSLAKDLDTLDAGVAAALNLER